MVPRHLPVARYRYGTIVYFIYSVFLCSSGGPDLAQYAGKKHINRGRWNKEEDEKLKRLVEVNGERWDFIASHFPDRADVQCQHRWQKVVNPELVKGNNSVCLFSWLEF